MDCFLFTHRIFLFKNKTQVLYTNLKRSCSYKAAIITIMADPIRAGLQLFHIVEGLGTVITTN